MRKIMMALTILLAGAAAPALAGESGCPTPLNAETKIVPTSEVAKTLEDMGYRVLEIEFEDGCYKVKAVNESGYPINAIYDPATGELLGAGLRRPNKDRQAR